ncbi:hypothetical protein Ahy_B04g070893 isoform F [Arachis hypogaea]|uniref:Uncharacterized protein n=1 Tax=Arachis hypogaea TaxID=3818 RepID=A0A444ZJQ5_ARAHY|nr:hypothetical protein Ahy_B04g070893 isoform F [Arachis hypogaea]
MKKISSSSFMHF